MAFDSNERIEFEVTEERPDGTKCRTVVRATGFHSVLETGKALQIAMERGNVDALAHMLSKLGHTVTQDSQARSNGSLYRSPGHPALPDFTGKRA